MTRLDVMVGSLFHAFYVVMFSARSERYHHLASDEDDETNDEESSLEIRQFSSWSNRLSKVWNIPLQIFVILSEQVNV